MTRRLNLLTARQVETLKTPGRHADGGGLYLRVSGKGARSWIFMAVNDGKRAEIGLGSALSVRLAHARELAGKMREAIARGENPRNVMRKGDSNHAPVQAPTFGAFAHEYLDAIEAGWKNDVHRKQWRQSLRDHAAALSDKRVDQITTDDLVAVLEPIWLSKAETARRLRGRIERILNAAKARGLRPRDAMNPATWRGHLQLLLPSQSNIARGHHAALAWQNAPHFMAELRKRAAPVARCLEFTILTAARSGEALGASWSEINLTDKLWTIPATRMKASAEHTVPLSAAAITLLEALRPTERPKLDQIFSVQGAVRSNMAMTMLLRRIGRGDVTVHGFRSTFRDWAGDATAYPRELIEQALAHTIVNKTERAYRRGTAIERRRELMEAWAAFLAG